MRTRLRRAQAGDRAGPRPEVALAACVEIEVETRGLQVGPLFSVVRRDPGERLARTVEVVRDAEGTCMVNSRRLFESIRSCPAADRVGSDRQRQAGDRSPVARDSLVAPRQEIDSGRGVPGETPPQRGRGPAD